MCQAGTYRKRTTHEMGALASYSVIAGWSLILMASLNYSVWNKLHVINFIAMFTMALIALIPLYWLRIKSGYLAGAVINLAYMFGGIYIDPPAPWVSNPNPLNVLVWGVIYSIAVLGVYFSVKSYKGA